MKRFKTSSYFSTQGFPYKDLLGEDEFAWEALGKLATFFLECELGKIECKIPEGVELIHPELISIGEGTIVEPGSFIKGPCIIGKECEVRHGAYIRGHVITGNRCVIGHSSEVKRSIFLNDVCAAHFNYVGDSILGNRVNLGAGAKLANLRLDHGEVVLTIEGKRISTGLSKLGAIIGDGAQLGCNVVTNPGTLIGKGALCSPCLSIGGVVPPGAKIKTNPVVCEYVDRSRY